MKLRSIAQLFSLKDIRSAIVSVVIVGGGLGLTALTLYAHANDNPQLAGIAAGLSLVFVLLIIIFVVPPLARNAGREAAQMNLPFEFTTGGAVMLVLVMVVGFSAWNTGNNLLFLVLSFLLGSLVVGFIAGSISLKRLSVKLRFPDIIHAGESVPFMVVVENGKRLFPTFSLLVDIRGRDRESNTVAADLEKVLPKRIAKRLSRPPIVRRTVGHVPFVKAGNSADSKLDIVFERRGKFVIQDFELVTRFPFGFFRHRRRLAADEKEIFVLPKLRPFDTPETFSSMGSISQSIERRGGKGDLAGLREYQRNDDPRHIDWKATARTAQLTIREHSAETSTTVSVIFDTTIPVKNIRKQTLRDRVNQIPVIDDRTKQFEKGVETVASILNEIANKEIEFNLFIDGESPHFTSNSDQLNNALKRLSTVALTGERNELNEDVARNSINSGISQTIVVTANDDVEIWKGLSPLKIVKF